MGEKVLMKGNEAIGEAAIRANCKAFFGYPITPQTEVAAYMAKKMPKIGRTFIQAESEVSAINMVYGAAGTGLRCMTSSSSPGISLKAEGISYIAGAELPCVIVNIVRGGPGLGSIQPAQSDYFQATKGGAHGDFNMPVFAPSSIQEMVDLIQDAFDVADMYRTPCMVMGDGMLGQMMEPVEFKERQARELPEKTWAANGLNGRTEHNIINSLYLEPELLEDHNIHLQKKYSVIKANEVRYEVFNCESDCDLILVAYGTTSRICKNVIKMAAKEGIKLGLVRPITLWPFPVEAFENTIDKTKHGYLSVEMSCGQMVEDVRLVVSGRKPVDFYGRSGGMVPDPTDILNKVKDIVGGAK
ncbi:3-methyl-2-oxobutanoate dehydrogenase subunit VorB [Clostridium thailandense]|uniref:3-methyl-2-oxobutanoate dehydrogenase subunit VorB n=1 Tax=Clostridium thailandense TaxID=2794346 RepID=A0A949TV55_9CLOT|nr:3-methyl-2-oxobutanoate dehydrogenase subunit VorB [Clostridium thailandense]MBV7271573.1 3-methyl-2-oxobutanoate dehydrogenase subunit VorB [Clostridium thailandense]MCH5136457.1 3-methyl-2-oxobutanoate dehydrogenase subunit VorB [Clostridiaceae bacterium UIB06]